MPSIHRSCLPICVQRKDVNSYRTCRGVMRTSREEGLVGGSGERAWDKLWGRDNAVCGQVCLPKMCSEKQSQLKPCRLSVAFTRVLNDEAIGYRDEELVIFLYEQGATRTSREDGLVGGPEERALDKLGAEIIDVGKAPGSMAMQGTQQVQNPPIASNGNNDDDSWINMVRKEVKRARPKHFDHRSNPRTIFKVPDHLRQCDEKAYEPVVVPIGPFHHHDPSKYTPAQDSKWRCRDCHDPNRHTPLQDCKWRPMQDYKWRCLRHLLSRHRSREQATEILDQCLSKLRELDAKVRSSYSFDISYLEPRKLALIMLLDGCFIIQLLLVTMREEEAKRIEEEGEEDGEEVGEVGGEEGEEENIGEQNVVVLDIGEEEEKIDGPLVGGLSIWEIVGYDLLKLENQIPFFVIQTLFSLLKTSRDEDVDLAKLALLFFTRIDPNNSENILQNFDEFNREFKKPGCQIHHLLHLFHSSLVPSQTPAQQQGQEPYSIPSATDLTRAGVKFREQEKAACFLDITFDERTLCIPPLQVHDYTNSLFRNLIAFEECYPSTRRFLKWYAFFMDSIIDSVEDAQLLNRKGIIRNGLETEEAAANLFNQLYKQVNYDPDRNYLDDQCVKVITYYKSSYHQKLAAFKRTYCNSPWAAISVVAAILLFLLTLEQSVFSGLSYLRPP